MKRSLIPLIILLIVGACAPTKKTWRNDGGIILWDLSDLSPQEQQMANELLSYGLEHEALFTLMDDLKPISSLGRPITYPIAKTKETPDGTKMVIDPKADSIDTALEHLAKWHKILGALSTDKVEFMLVPFRQSWDGKRNLQILACRRDIFDELMEKHSAFFGQWGFTKHTDASTVLTAIEFEERNDRFRAYGYLFGYPEHAVDFFVEASISEEETGDFVKRDFFHVPVAVGKPGYFTYAIPKGYVPTQTDSAIYKQAVSTLEFYNELKPKYLKRNGELDALLLLSTYWLQR